MATGGLYGQSSAGIVSPQSGSESSGLYGNNTVFGGTYFEWFIFQVSDTQPATPTGGSWSFTTNSGTPPSGWLGSPPANPTNTVWVSVGLVNSKSSSAIEWSTPGKFSFASGLPILSGASEPTSGDGQSDQLYIQTNTAPETIWFKQAGTWTRLTGPSLYVDLTSNQTIAGTKTFSSEIQGSISGNAANVTGIVDITHGGTGSTTASAARTALGLGTAATQNSNAFATAAQGAKADSAVQTIASADGSVTVTGTTAIDLSVAISGSTTNVLCLVRNTTGATLTKGTVVYISGATGQNPTVSKAIATSDTTSAQTLGMMTADLANNSNGYVTVIGLITNIDTSAYSDGQQLYLSGTTAGAVTGTKPYAPTHLVYVAVVEHAHPTQGKLFVKVQNGYELDELHNVSAQTPSNGQTIVYNSSTSLWENNTVSLTAGVNGTLPIANGGTGQTTANAAFNALAPSQAGNSGKYLTTDGSNTSWATNPLGTVTSVNASGGTTGLTFSGGPITTSGTLTLAGTLATANGGTNLTSFTANGVMYASSTSALATGSVLTFDGAQLGVNGITIGRGAGAVSSNIAIGLNAFTTNTTGAQNVAIGRIALAANSTGNYNVAVGTGALNASTSSNNTAVGYTALYSTSSGENNTAFGYGSLQANTTASNNTAVGYQAGYSNTTGAITALGYRAGYSGTTADNATALGSQALYSQTTGVSNTAVGYASMLNTTTSNDNSALGTSSLYSNTTGASNTAIGRSALYSNTTASNNTAVGYQAGYSNSTGSNSTFVGYQAGYTGSDADSMTAVGYQAGYSATAAGTDGMTAIGRDALRSNTSGPYNTAVGYRAGYANATGGYSTWVGYLAGESGGTDLDYTTAVGYGALRYNQADNNTAIGAVALTANTTGSYNTAVGAAALLSSTTGNYSTAVGYRAAYNTTTHGITAIGSLAGFTNTTGAGNLAVGALALYNNTTGADNTALGNYDTNSGIDAALYNNTTGSNNVGVGTGTLRSNTTASDNVAVGYRAGYSNTTGTYNLFLGTQSGNFATTANANHFIGYTAGYSTTTGGNNVAIGYQTFYGNTTGGSNVAVGQQALASNTTASNNTAVGYQAGYSNTTGYSNAYLGIQAGYSATTALACTFLGAGAGYSATTGTFNTFVGQGAGYYITTGGKNTIIGGYTGNQGGLDIRTASNYIVLSDGDGNPRGVFDSSGNFLVGKTSTSFTSAGAELRAGGIAAFVRDSSSATLYVVKPTATYTTGNMAEFRYNDATVVGTISYTSSSVAYNTSSDYRLKNITGPITNSGDYIDSLNPVEGTWKSDGSVFVGLLAHEAQESSRTPVATGVKDGEEMQAMTYSSPEMIANMIAEIQSLRKRLAAAGI